MMKRLLIGLVACLLSSQAIAAPAVVNLGSANNTTSLSNLTITLPNSLAAGSTILVAMTHTDTGTTCNTVTTLADTAGNTYGNPVAFPNLNVAPTNGQLCVWLVSNSLSLSSGNTIVASSVQGFATATAIGVTGVLASPVDVSGIGTQSSGFCNVNAFGGITTTVSGDMIVGFCGWAKTGATTANFNQDTTVAWASPPNAQVYTANNIGIAGGSFLQSSAGTLDYEPSISGGAPVAQYLVALKAIGGGGSSPQRARRGYGN